MYSVLEEGGVIIVGQRNHDLLLDKKIRFFPVRFEDGEVFFYVLDYKNESIGFNVVNVDTVEEDFEVYSTKSMIIKHKNLLSKMEKVGFEVEKIYGENTNELDIDKDFFYRVVGIKKNN